MQKTSLFIVLVMFFSCKKDPPLFSINNLNNNKITILGHGGMGEKSLYPMNSEKSLNTCLEIGSDGTECDIQLTSDSTLMIFHNRELDESTACNGIIAELNVSQVNGCNYSNLFSGKQNILELNKWYNSIKKNHPNSVITLDCKLYNGKLEYVPYLKSFARAVSRFINDNKLHDLVNVESSNPFFLTYIHEIDKNIRTFIYVTEMSAGIEISKLHPVNGITIDNDLVNALDIKSAHENNLQVALFGMTKENDNTDAMKKSPDYLQCDKLSEVLKILDKYNP